MTLMVRPEILRTFNNQVQDASRTIAGEDSGAKVTAAGDGLPGSTTQWICQMVGNHVAGVEKKIADAVSAQGVAVRGVGDTFEVADGALATSFGKIYQ